MGNYWSLFKGLPPGYDTRLTIEMRNSWFFPEGLPHGYDSGPTTEMRNYRLFQEGLPSKWLADRIGLWRLVVLFWWIFVGGCESPHREKVPPDISGPTKLTVVVWGDARLADTVRSYEAQWQKETGGQLEVHTVGAEGATVGTEESAWRQLSKADVILFPSDGLGELAQTGRILPLREEHLMPHASAWTDLLDKIRDQEGRWGAEVWAVPLGSPVLVCYCRADILTRLGLSPPRTWDEYFRLAQQLQERSRLGDVAPPADRPWWATAEPLGPGWAGLMLLARAASYAKHPDYFSTLFDMESMRPRIDTPPFVRALEELVAVARLVGPESLLQDPDQVRERFWRGECALALTWPTRSGPEKAAPGVQCTIVPIPGASALWHPEQLQWIPPPQGELVRTPLLGMAGRWAALGAQTDHCSAALALIFWLADKQGAEPRPAVCPATTVFRKSDLKNPQRLRAWVEPAMTTSTALQYAEALQQTLSSAQEVLVLRIPGRKQYLAALDEAVLAAMRAEKTPQEALHHAAQKWQTITQQFGLENQRQAYRRNLGL